MLASILLEPALLRLGLGRSFKSNFHESREPILPMRPGTKIPTEAQLRDSM